MSDNNLGHIDQYVLLRELGGGGFGCVYLARDTVSDVDVAVKGLPPLVRNNLDELENIRRNFALVSRLHHPNIAAALTLHPASDVSYKNKSDADKLRVFKGDTLVVMQYAPGMTLSKWVRQFPGGIVPIEKAVEITMGIALALDYAHAEKILHRDIKPQNVMIDDGDGSQTSVRVLDFGLAAEIHSSLSRVSNDISSTSGTRPYMAPEQWVGSDQGQETDQYSLAVLFHELVTGKVPFASAFDTGDPLVMFGAVSRKTVDIPSWLPKTVRQALVKALSKKRESRFRSCAEFADALRNGVKSQLTPVMLVAAVSACALLVAGAVVFRLSYGRVDETVVAEPLATVTAETQESPRVPKTVYGVDSGPVDIEGPDPVNASETVPVSAVVASADPVADTVETSPPAVVSAKTAAPVSSSVSASTPVPVPTPAPTPAPAPAPTPVSASVPDSTPAPPQVIVVQAPAPVPPPEVKKEPVLPPELRIVAVYDGKELKGAKIQTMNGTFELPYRWEGSLANRRHLGPYRVTYDREGKYLTGEFKVEPIDWSGLRTVKVELKRSDRRSEGGILKWAF